MSAALKFLNNLKVHFPPRLPRPELEEAWVQSMVKELRGYSSPVLEAAASEIIRTRKRTDFPLPSECRDVCEAIKKREENAARAAELPVGANRWMGRDSIFSPERKRLADELIIGPMGKEAARDGWILSLHVFIRENGRLPDARKGEINKMKAAAKGFDEAYAQCVRGGWPEAAKWMAFGDDMLARRAELTERVENGVIGR
jgi:hypothetical protein